MRDHFIHGSIAAVVAAAIAGGVTHFAPVSQIVHSIQASKHAWPDLTDAQKADLARRLKALAPLKFEIVSADAASVDLAQDIDDAVEDAGTGVESVLDRPALPLPYGLYVQGEEGDDKADALAAALTAVIGIEAKVVRASTAGSGYPLWVLIGKAPRK